MMNEENPQIIIEFSGSDASIRATNITPFQLLGAAQMLLNEGNMAYAMMRMQQNQQASTAGLTLARAMPKVPGN